MMRSAALSLLLLLLSFAASANEAAALHVSKPAQRALAIGTVSVSSLEAAGTQEAWGEVVSHPTARASVQAPQSGRLVAAAGGWPAAGQAVKAGAVLALLEPVMSAREIGLRRAELALLEQKLGLAEVNAERLALQAQAGNATGNVYLEQAVTEAESLRRQVELLRQSLSGRIEIRAAEAGWIQSTAASVGEVVSRGQALFELSAAGHGHIAVRLYDAALLAPGIRAAARLPDGSLHALRLQGHGTNEPEPGWTLWFDVAQPPSMPLAVGLPLLVQLTREAVADGTLRLPRGSVLGGDAPYVWLHTAPERFERRALQVVGADGDAVTVRTHLQPDDRLVRQGAALLSQYR